MNLCDGRFAEGVDALAAFEVHDLLVAKLSFRRLAHRCPGIRLAANEGLEVMAGREVLTRARQDDHAHFVVCVGDIQEVVNAVDQRGVLRVRHIRAVHGDGRDMTLYAVEHTVVVHGYRSSICTRWTGRRAVLFPPRAG